MKLYLIAVLLALTTLCADVFAQYPTKPLRIINPFAAGGGGDALTRIVSKKITDNTGKLFVVEAKVGAAGRIGYEAGARAPGDGYTLIITDPTYTMMPGLYGALPWGNDLNLVPVTILGQTRFVIVVSPNLKISSLKELIALAQAKPGKINFGSAGVGSVTHVTTELFKREAAINMTHIPYKGMGDAITGIFDGSIEMLMIGILTGAPHIKSGKMAPLAVAATRRSPVLPDVPSTAEAGLPKFTASNWFGWSAPKGTPKESVDWLHREVAKALASADVRELIAQQGSEPSGITPEEFTTMVTADMQRWAEVIRAAGIKAE